MAGEDAMKKLLVLAMAALAAAASAAAQESYPTRPITLVVPYPAGGVTDTLARLLAERMKQSLAQTIVIENVGGAGGSIGVGRIARGTPDGYTIVIGSSETHVLNAVALHLNFDVVNDFEPVVQLPAYPFLIVSPNSVPATTLKEFIGWIKANPDKVTQGTVGYGTIQHMCGVIMQKTLGVTWQIRAYAITMGTRAESAPEIPTADEAGMPGLHLLTWNALYAPKGTPRLVIDKLNAAAVQAMADPTFRKRMVELALEMPPSDQLTPEALGALQKSDIETWWPLMRAAGIKPQ
jgi:tripartite-type tricarboxylate transporter receptor subunit TctC